VTGNTLIQHSYTPTAYRKGRGKNERVRGKGRGEGMEEGGEGRKVKF